MGEEIGNFMLKRVAGFRKLKGSRMVRGTLGNKRKRTLGNKGRGVFWVISYKSQSGVFW